MTNERLRRERFARDCWLEIREAAIGPDDRQLWFVWTKNFPFRFWRELGAPGVGALCRVFGIEYRELLRRITAYDTSLDPERREEEARRACDSPKTAR